MHIDQIKNHLIGRIKYRDDATQIKSLYFYIVFDGTLYITSVKMHLTDSVIKKVYIITYYELYYELV